MSVPMHCPVCGYRGIARRIRIENSIGTRIMGGGEPCPRCGSPASYQSGVYDFAGAMIAAFRPLSRNDLIALRDIAYSVKSGRTSVRQATAKVQNFGPAVAQVWDWTNRNSGGLGLLLTILGLMLTLSLWYLDHKSDSSAPASANRRPVAEGAPQAGEGHHSTDHSSSSEPVSEQQLLDQVVRALQQLPPAQRAALIQSMTGQRGEPPSARRRAPEERPVANRHERLKAKALARKNSKKS